MKGKLEMKVKFIWYDFWIGLYYDKDKKMLYFCPLPTLVFIFKFRKRADTKQKEILR